MSKMIVIIILATFSIILILSYFFDWKIFKKNWQEKPYHKFDKIYGITLGTALLLFSIYLMYKLL